MPARTTFREYAERWIAALTTDLSSRAAVEGRLRLHALPYLGSRPIGSFQPEHIRDWSRQLEETVGSASYRRLIFDAVSSVLNAAVDDRLLASNPCRARSVKAPRPAPTRVHPWGASQVFGVRAGLPERFQAMVDVGAGCGFRQGEIFGVSQSRTSGISAALRAATGEEGSRWARSSLRRERGKLRTFPSTLRSRQLCAEHMKASRPCKVTLPWLTPSPPKVTQAARVHGACRIPPCGSNAFNDQVWKPALASAGIIPSRRRVGTPPLASTGCTGALRHFYASILLDAGESIKALSLYLGHGDPGFTLRAYTHLMPSSETRTRNGHRRPVRRCRTRTHNHIRTNVLTRRDEKCK